MPKSAKKVLEEMGIHEENDGVKEVEKPKATTPWKPATLLQIPKKYQKQGWVYRFCSKEESRAGNVRKKEAEGWIIDKEIIPKMLEDGVYTGPTIQDSKRGLDNTFQIRELIVMRMSKEMAEARSKYFQDRADQALRTTEKNLDSELKRGGSRKYGNLDVVE